MSDPDLDSVKYCKIFPGIGVARVGNSPDGYFIGPETPGLTEEPLGGYKDAAGRVKRQAARFRIYGFDETNKVVAEITSKIAEITWTVQVANKKAVWYEFKGVKAGLDTDSGKRANCLRNRRILGDDRKRLVVAPTPRSITGAEQQGNAYRFDDGSFMSIPVPLGELRTDNCGRLLVLGGYGHTARTPEGKPITNYANNDYWFDDTSDGPVTAKVKIGSREISVNSSWVIVAPPDFAPFTDNIVNLYEVMEAAVAGAVQSQPGPLSFTNDLYPFFARVAGYEWVNEMSLRGHGPNKGGNFLSESVFPLIRDRSPKNQKFRDAIFGRIRNPHLKSKDQANFKFMPLLSGDEGDVEENDPQKWLYILEGQYDNLQQWAQGNFIDDWPPNTRPGDLPIKTWEEYSLAEQPAALNRAALERCVGGAFFPGIEISYIARDPGLYEEPFRIKSTGHEAGDMTKRMALPWQADFFECQVHWWPAQRPDDVLNEEEYDEIRARFPTEQNEGKLAAAALRRLPWDRGVGQRTSFLPSDFSQPVPPSTRHRSPKPGDNDMVAKWSQMGFVVQRETVDKDKNKQRVLVETGRSRYDGLRDREYFYLMMNLDSFPDFRSKARGLAQDFLDHAWEIANKDASEGGVDDIYRYFGYSSGAFAQRMEEIYNAMRRDADAAQALYQKFDPKTSTKQDDGGEPHSRDECVERIRQWAPFNQTDGAWLRNVSQAGPIDEVSSLLFSVWMDEAGDGNPDQNHANLYTRLLESVGIELPPVTSLAYAMNPDMLESAYTAPLFQLVMSEFTRTFFPELLGMTLQLEWEVLGLWKGIYRLEFWDIDAHFYRMHVGIDNAADGHGAKARRAVELYLDHVRKQTGSEEEVQRQWRRIWTGYVAFAAVGTLGEDFNDLLDTKRAATPETRLLKVIERKKPYARYNHGQKQLGANYINDWFEDPQGLLDTLAATKDLIIPGDIEKSRFFQRLTFEGPMYKVFSEQEVDLWREWVLWLPKKRKAEPAPVDACDRPYVIAASEPGVPSEPGEPQIPPAPVESDIAKRMVLLIQFLKPQQEGTAGHRKKITGPDPDNPGQQVTQPVSWWFKQSEALFMQALANEQNGWIVSGDPAKSKFVTDLLDPSNGMGRAYQAPIPGTGGKTGKEIAVEWIAGGCPTVAEGKAEAQTIAFDSMASPPSVAGEAFRLNLYSTKEQRARHPRGTILGMGTVH